VTAGVAVAYPAEVRHWIDDGDVAAVAGEVIEKRNPRTGQVLGHVARGRRADALRCVDAAEAAFEAWSGTSIVTRGEILRRATLMMMDRREEIAAIVSLETGKSNRDALGEVGAAVEMGLFIAGEAHRFYGRTTTSAIPHRTAMTVRQPVGPAALILAANTPIANVAWKAFPALLCGNPAVLKASEDTPYTALWFARLLREAGLPGGVFSVLQGLGEEAGAPLVEDDRIRLVSFTGSVPVGRYIQRVAGARLAKVCLELGGKNPFVVCDDADLDAAARAATLSAFSNAGQRCASGSRILVFDRVYDDFRARLLARTAALRVGPHDDDDLGPVINGTHLHNILAMVDRAVRSGQVSLAAGGYRLETAAHADGYYMAPTILEDARPDAEVSQEELFGPVTCLYRVSGFEAALRLANDTSFGLTAAVHTRSIHRAEVFRDRCRAGVISINGPTYGSEPHMPFGGLKNSGNGFREAGTEALDVYSDWKSIYTQHDPSQL
jgi:acyl-CoA reductase-like NAD-dependent aldehyde dehydrogenase